MSDDAKRCALCGATERLRIVTPDRGTRVIVCGDCQPRLAKTIADIGDDPRRTGPAPNRVTRPPRGDGTPI